MNFWKSFFTQPMLWLLAIGVIIISSEIANLTPKLSDTRVSRRESSFWGGFGELGAVHKLSDEEVRKRIDANRSSPHNLVADVLSDYVSFSGGWAGEVVLRDGMVFSRIWERHHTGMAGIITALLLFGVVLITRRSNSAIFILGPLLVGWIIAVILMTITANTILHSGETVDASVKFSTVSMFGNWLTFNLIVGLAVWIGTRYILVGWGLIRGIDEEGPLDFSKLQRVAATTAETIKSGLDKAGDKLQQTIGEGVTNSPLLSPAEGVTPSDTTSSDSTAPTQVLKPIGNLATHCPWCGHSPLSGAGDRKSCSKCKALVGVAIPKPELGFCPRCGSNMVHQAKFCWRCGGFFDQLD